MTQRTVQRFAVAAALAGSLFLAAAAPAQARDLGPVPPHAWQWLQDLWTKASALWDWSGPPAPAPGTSGHLWKQGHATDPDGSPNSSTSSAGPACDTCGDQGHGSDPNG
jgi:hypothetical protein